MEKQNLYLILIVISISVFLYLMYQHTQTKKDKQKIATEKENMNEDSIMPLIMFISLATFIIVLCFYIWVKTSVTKANNVISALSNITKGISSLTNTSDMSPLTITPSS